MHGKWIISDLDGTLLNSRQQIPEAVKKRVRLFRQYGGVFTLATGRSLSSALPFIEELDIQVPVILYNGAKLYDPVEKVFFKEHYLPQSSCRYALDMYEGAGRQMGLNLLMFHQEHIYSPAITQIVERYMRKDKVHVSEKSPSAMSEQCKRATKIMFIGDFAALHSFHDKFFHCSREPHQAEWHTVQSEPELLEILPPHVNKGSACLDLVAYLGLDLTDFSAVGDNLNDIELLSLVGHGFAVQNAHPQLKATADWVTDRSNDEDAILEVFDHIQQLYE
ncbi:Cof-type HAD-IIB family hydrolase [Paenibacillus xerothermodurans]|uniref:Cof-type HAD-IIB family hydrolase n=1 Tax=Paenibacillus xerothermodurans TaxID=1977292 RepID=A0A2W1NSA8_PAEXE|nr:Cof-type HAD-IIB family hydrolase [Paenibacillus xerothermodurans]PZE20636.1 Cof-type HAD-IIB family hydrolase [Paenibacillus xerothermodurans]